jgi:hypothetical protein
MAPHNFKKAVTSRATFSPPLALRFLLFLPFFIIALGGPNLPKRFSTTLSSDTFLSNPFSLFSADEKSRNLRVYGSG